MFERLKWYKLKYGDCLVPQHYEDDPLLGKWVKNQRRIFKRGTMEPFRVEQLNSIGFCWNKKALQNLQSGAAPNWNDMFEWLKQYKLECGDCLVP
jgi:hypothetical protein